MMDIGAMRSARLAVVGLDTTTGVPPLITEVAVTHLAGGVITAGPWVYWTAPDAPWHQIRRSSWPNVRLAPPWTQVADRVLDALADRMLVLHDRDRLAVLEHHLPDWVPLAAVFTRDMARQVWPALDDLRLGPLSVAAGVNVVPRLCPGGAIEAHTVALLLPALIREAGRQAERPAVPAAVPNL
jgi:hypothetical protein